MINVGKPNGKNRQNREMFIFVEIKVDYLYLNLNWSTGLQNSGFWKTSIHQNNPDFLLSTGRRVGKTTLLISFIEGK